MNVEYTHWQRPRSVGELLDDGRPRPLAGSASGFDLSWHALDAWALSRAQQQPCEIRLVGFARREDGFYWYIEEIDPAYLRDVLGYREKGGKLVPLCPGCDQYPRHARGCEFGP